LKSRINSKVFVSTKFNITTLRQYSCRYSHLFRTHFGILQGHSEIYCSDVSLLWLYSK